MDERDLRTNMGNRMAMAWDAPSGLPAFKVLSLLDEIAALRARAERAEADGRIDGLEAAVYAIDSESVLGGTKREHMAAVNMRDGLARKVRFLLQNARAAIDRARSQGGDDAER